MEGTPLAQRHAAITGGGRGIGLAIAETLARLGADLTLIGRDEAQVSERADQLAGRYGVRAGIALADMTDADGIAAAFAGIAAGPGMPDILVNNAGIAPSAPFAKTDVVLWNKVMAVDLTGAFVCTRQVLPAMIERGWGRVVNIASTAGLKGYAYTAAYCAAKHGLIGLTRALALETARTGVTVNAVCPGFTDTDLVRGATETISAKTGRTADEAAASLAANNPQRRLVEPWEVAEAAAWLCLPSSASLTGQSIVVAGGEVM